MTVNLPKLLFFWKCLILPDLTLLVLSPNWQVSVFHSQGYLLLCEAIFLHSLA